MMWEKYMFAKMWISVQGHMQTQSICKANWIVVIHWITPRATLELFSQLTEGNRNCGVLCKELLFSNFTQMYMWFKEVFLLKGIADFQKYIMV